ncbi:hypothetical protein EIB72_28170 [Burkholderia ambifaria]|nr:hypothetical protein [Burkholderia ambifaria]NHL70261.1 hypothetical protein [Burkholderia ambifaria]
MRSRVPEQRAEYGSIFPARARSQLPGMVEDATNGKVQLAPFVTHAKSLSDINEAFAPIRNGKSIRAVVHQ